MCLTARIGALRHPELGGPKPAGVGDAGILQLRAGQCDLVDSRGDVVTASERLYIKGLVLAGQWHDAGG